jgi:hypothetical protein
VQLKITFLLKIFSANVAQEWSDTFKKKHKIVPEKTVDLFAPRNN